MLSEAETFIEIDFTKRIEVVPGKITKWYSEEDSDNEKRFDSEFEDNFLRIFIK